MADFNIDIDITNNKDEILNAFQEQIAKGLEAIGATAEGYAKDDCPVDTGRLRNSIAYAVVENEVQIGTNVEYAPPVEYRDIAHETGKAHFLRDAATTHGDEYQAIMQAALQS
mgnify:CR=1 FL=1